jgi:hypothetical protein
VSIFSSNLSSSDSWSMTVLSRLLNYIAIITKVNMDSWPKIVDDAYGRINKEDIKALDYDTLQAWKRLQIHIKI